MIWTDTKIAGLLLITANMLLFWIHIKNAVSEKSMISYVAGVVNAICAVLIIAFWRYL